MRLSYAIVLLLVLLAHGEGRHVSQQFGESSKASGFVIIPTKGSPHSNSYSSRDSSSSQLEVESRGPFSDLWPYVGSFVYRTAVRRVLVKPMIKGMKRLVPPSAVSYIKESMGNRKFIKIMSPLRPMVSSYAYNKFEQGVFWTLNRSYTMVKDNFFEFDESERRKLSRK